MEYALSELFTLQMGKTPSRDNSSYWKKSENNWISIADLTNSGKYISNTKETLSDSAVAESGIKKIPANTVIMSFKLSLGKVAITEKEMYSNEAIMAFIDKGVEKISPEYLYYLLRAKDWSKGTNKAVMGATLNKATLSTIKIQLHEYDNQLEIVNMLNRVSSSIDFRKQQLTKLDELIKARFVEMFGDPVKNTMDWEIKSLSELGELNRGVSKARPRNSPELLGGPYPLIQTGEVANAKTYITSFNSTYSEKGLAQSKMWPKGTLCITIAANIAQTSILTFDACFPDSVVGFISRNMTNELFIHYWFSFFQKILDEQAPQVAQKNINLKILSELNVIVPPLSLQNQFAAFVAEVDKSKLFAELFAQNACILAENRSK